MQAVLGICQFLNRAGTRADCVASVGPEDDVSHLSTDFSDVNSRLFLRSGCAARYAGSRSFAEWLPRALGDYDLVEIHAIFSVFTWRAAMLCRTLGKPYLIRPHGSLDPFDLRKHALLKQIVGPPCIRPMLSGAEAVLVTAQMEADRMEAYAANVRKVVMPLPVTLAVGLGDRTGFRTKHRIPPDAQVVLFLSRIDYKKGLDFLIPALGKLKETHQKLWFVLAGGGGAGFISRVRGWLAAHQVQSFTSEVGFVSGQDKLDAFAAADIFALPSLNENFGIVNIEAMHAGLPLLISDQVYICREIDAAGAGIICKPSIESVTEKLRMMLSGSIDLPVMGQRGRELVRTRYRPEAATDALAKLYREIVTKS